jgi:peptide/nickel transport system substrate-binding protein
MLLALTFACAPQATGPAREPESAGQKAPTAQKALNVVLVGAALALSMWRESTTGNIAHLHEIIENGLIGQNANSEPIPRLAAEVPSVEKGTWKVSPDGTMETTYRLQPNARWHDGTPFTSKDVVFSAKAQLDPGVEIFVRGLRSGGVDGVDAPDDRTVVMRWSGTYGFADSLRFWEFTPLPAHVLQSVYERDVTEFNQATYWTDPEVFVSTGPFRLTRWDKGARMEFGAFDQYYLGKPKVDRIVVDFAQDDNIATARVLAGEIDIAWGGKWDKNNIELVRGRGLGDFVLSRENYAHLTFQFKDMADPIELARDVRLRRALAYALDTEAANLVGTDALGLAADSWIPRDDPRYAAAEPFIQKYPHDPQRAQQFFAEAGWNKGSDGLLHNPAGRTLGCSIRGIVGAEPVAAVMADNWRGAGVDAQIEDFPQALWRDLEVRATMKCVEHSARTLGRSALEHLHSRNAMVPERRYAGNNRGAYMIPQLDGQIDRFFSALTLSDRLQGEREVLRTITTDLPLIPTYFYVQTYFQKKGVSGNFPKTGLDIQNSQTWNIHEWDKT